MGGNGAISGVVFGGTNYVSCVGTGNSSSGVVDGDYVSGDGVFLLLPGGPTTILNITDGTSNTALQRIGLWRWNSEPLFGFGNAQSPHSLD